MNRKTIGLALGIVCLAGCATTPTSPPQPQSFASYVSDPASVSFEEVVVAVPVEGAHQVYQNLHVALDAIINARNVPSSSSNQVEWIIRRLEPRVSAATLKVVTDGNTLSPHKLGELREIIASRAQDVVKQTLAQWTHGSEYEVEVTIVSMYFTDSSVGRVPRGKGW